MFLKRLQVLLNCCYALSPRVAATCIARDRRGDAWLTALAWWRAAAFPFLLLLPVPLLLLLSVRLQDPDALPRQPSSLLPQPASLFRTNCFDSSANASRGVSLQSWPGLFDLTRSSRNARHCAFELFAAAIRPVLLYRPVAPACEHDNTQGREFRQSNHTTGVWLAGAPCLLLRLERRLPGLGAVCCL